MVRSSGLISGYQRQSPTNVNRDYEMEIELDPTISGDDDRLGALANAGALTDAQATRRAAVCVLLWYLFSISLSVYNKWMFSEAFPIPILTTSLHQLVQTILAIAAIKLLKIKAQLVDASSLGEFIYRVGPTVLASAADIGLGNSSLQVITLSFYTMVKSSGLGFVLLFSILFGLERATWRLTGIIGLLTVGVFMMVEGETEFNWLGFFLVLGAACASGLRWALVKLLLLGKSWNYQEMAKPHPVQMVLAISPGMFLALSILGLICEGPRKFLEADLWSERPVPIGIILLLLPGTLAFCMTWSEFELLNVTGPLTLAVAGICKEVATIIVSILVFHDPLSLVNAIGLFVTIVAIAIYHFYRHNLDDEKRTR